MLIEAERQLAERTGTPFVGHNLIASGAKRNVEREYVTRVVGYQISLLSVSRNH